MQLKSSTIKKDRRSCIVLIDPSKKSNVWFRKEGCNSTALKKRTTIMTIEKPAFLFQKEKK